MNISAKMEEVMTKKMQIGFDLTEKPPGWDPKTHEIIARIPENARALRELEEEGFVQSRKNPVTGMREFRITKKGWRAAQKI
jgi:hypothetical protein